MKKGLFIFLLLLFAAISAFAQIKRYPLIEHFTNTRCGSCAANNPAFYAKALPFINKSVHHIAYHPSFPYSSCLLYQSNTEENSGRTAIYGVGLTPSYVVNGGIVQSVASLNVANLNAEVLKTSPLEVKVREKENSGNWTAKVELTAFGAIPAGKYRIVAALCEKTLAYNAPNGEKTHYDVFRKLLTAINGNEITNMPAPGNQIEFSFNYNLDASWNASEMYVLAWVVNNNTREVLNSGSRFSDNSSATTSANEDDIFVYPNPVAQNLVIDLSKYGQERAKYELISPLGQVLKEGFINGESETIPVGEIGSPYLLLRINSPKGVVVRKVLKN